jgi:hypothetical protein
MKLSQNQKKELEQELVPLLRPYFEHQGWGSVRDADTATQILVDMFREWGVRV